MILAKWKDYVLRILSEEDVYQVVEVVYENRDYLREYLDFVDQVGVESQRKVIRNWDREYREGTSVQGGLFLDGKFIGMVGLYIDRQNDLGEIGYWICQNHSGAGVVTNFVRNMVDIGFGSYGLNKISIRAVPRNEKSTAVAKRLGFFKEGVLVQEYKLNGVYEDLEIYSILRGDWVRGGD